MLEDILKGYSEGEISEIIGNKHISLYEKLTGKSVEKLDLVRAAIALNGEAIFSDKNQRHRFIDRMSKKNVDEALEMLLGEIEYKEPLPKIDDKYSLLHKLSALYNREFRKIFNNSLSKDELEDVPVQGIVSIDPLYPLYPYQQKIVNKVSSLIKNKKASRCLIHLPTGAGKTRTAMNIISDHLRENPSGLVLWLADTSELCNQASLEFQSAWKNLGDRSIKVYSYYSDTDISLGGIDEGFLVAGLQKINSIRGSDLFVLYKKLTENVSLVVFDEAHKAIAPTYSKTVNDILSEDKLRNSFLLGLSATPGRKIDKGDEEDKYLTEFFHKNKITMKISGYESPIKYLVEEGYLAKANFININYDGGKILYAQGSSSLNRAAEINKTLSDDENRNIRLIETIKREYEKGSSLIVFACSVEHSITIATMLAFDGIEAYSLDSKNDNTESRRLKIEKYSSGSVKVIINYNILTAGFDAPITNVAIIARPTDSLVQYSQMAGRAMRGIKSGGNKSCRIYTVRDDIPAFTSVVQAFSHWDSLWQEV